MKEEDLRPTAAGTAPKQPSGKDPRLVEHQQVAWRYHLREIGEDAVLQPAPLPVQDQQAASVPLLHRVLRDLLRGESEVEVRGGETAPAHASKRFACGRRATSEDCTGGA